MNNSFRFKQFTVKHGDSAMKVGTDAVLLGAWCDVTNARRVLDVGCGSGVIALMVAQRAENAVVEAVEIDEMAAKEAEANFGQSKWHCRLSVLCSDLFAFMPDDKYDLIVSNPPFYLEDILSPDSRRGMSRSNNSMPFEQLFVKVADMLSSEGRFAMVAPANARELVEFFAGEQNFWLKRRVGVRTKEGKPLKRYLWEFAKQPVDTCDSELTILDDNGNYSEEFIRLTCDFYLGM